MRRPILLTLAAVGGVIVLLGGTGLFAALTDTARSETNYIDSGALAPSADLQMATAQSPVGLGFGVTCGTFNENLTSNLIVINGAPGSDTGVAYPYCIRNLGSKTVSVTVMAENLNDIEMACTGDESAYDDDCGVGQGELGAFVEVVHERIDCGTGQSLGLLGMMLTGNAVAPASVGTIGAGETRCFDAQILQSSASEDQRQAAQSDRLTWQFAWTGQA